MSERQQLPTNVANGGEPNEEDEMMPNAEAEAGNAARQAEQNGNQAAAADEATRPSSPIEVSDSDDNSLLIPLITVNHSMQPTITSTITTRSQSSSNSRPRVLYYPNMNILRRPAASPPANAGDSDDEYVPPLPPAGEVRRLQPGSISVRDYWLANPPRNSYDRAVASIAYAAAANAEALDAVPVEPAPPAPPVSRRVTRSTTRNYRNMNSALASYSDSSPEPPAEAGNSQAAAAGNGQAAAAGNGQEAAAAGNSQPALGRRGILARLSMPNQQIRLGSEPVFRVIPISSPSSPSDDSSSSDDSASTSTSSSSTDMNIVADDDDDTNDNDADEFGNENANNSAEQLDIDDDGSNIFMESDDFEVNVDITEDLNEIMNKPRPSDKFNLTNELMRRERGSCFSSRYAPYNPIHNNFQTSFYASHFAIERMSCSGYLRRHTGCVNSLDFNKTGDLLVSGSDDTRIVIWDWQRTAVKHCFKSGHSRNIFQTKFINVDSGLDIVSSSLDGEVRRCILPPGANEPIIKTLYSHSGAVHKLCVSPHSQYEIISGGEDGVLKHKDIRIGGDPEQMICIKTRDVTVSLYSVDHHPFMPEICVSGTDNIVRVYDIRKMDHTLREMCPKHLISKVGFMITSAVYNYDGSEILASYGDENIYLFNNSNYVAGEYKHRYRGHLFNFFFRAYRNQQTIKGVNFFGPKSEYIISGSDCGHLFFWDKQTEAIVNFVRGDTSGVVNCLEPHPSVPVLAVSGLDRSVKLMSPCYDKNPPDLTKLQALVKGNLKRGVNGNTPGWDRRLFTYIMRQMLRRNELALGFNDDDDNDNDAASMHESFFGQSASSGLAALAAARRQRRQNMARRNFNIEQRNAPSNSGNGSNGRHAQNSNATSNNNRASANNSSTSTSTSATSTSAWVGAALASAQNLSSAALRMADIRPSVSVGGGGGAVGGVGRARTFATRTAPTSTIVSSELSSSINSLIRNSERITRAANRASQSVASITFRGNSSRGYTHMTIRNTRSTRGRGGGGGSSSTTTITTTTTSSSSSSSSSSSNSNTATEQQVPTGRRRRGHLDDDGPE